MLPKRNAPTDAFTTALTGRRAARIFLVVLLLGVPLILLPASFRLPAVDRDAIEVNRLSHHRSWTWLVGGRNAHAPGRRSSRRDYRSSIMIAGSALTTADRTPEATAAAVHRTACRFRREAWWNAVIAPETHSITPRTSEFQAGSILILLDSYQRRAARKAAKTEPTAKTVAMMAAYPLWVEVRQLYHRKRVAMAAT